MLFVLIIIGRQLTGIQAQDAAKQLSRSAHDIREAKADHAHKATEIARPSFLGGAGSGSRVTSQDSKAKLFTALRSVVLFEPDTETRCIALNGYAGFLFPSAAFVGSR